MAKRTQSNTMPWDAKYNQNPRVEMHIKKGRTQITLQVTILVNTKPQNIRTTAPQIQTIQIQTMLNPSYKYITKSKLIQTPTTTSNQTLIYNLHTSNKFICTTYLKPEPTIHIKLCKIITHAANSNRIIYANLTHQHHNYNCSVNKSTIPCNQYSIAHTRHTTPANTVPNNLLRNYKLEYKHYKHNNY
eukprot:gene3111-2093_t